MSEQDPKKFLPDVDELGDAADVCSNYAKYLELTEPAATNSISWLKNAADELSSAVSFFCDDEDEYDEYDEDEDEDDDEGEG